MATGFNNGLETAPAGDAHLELYPLLRTLLVELRRSRETPLQFGIDAEGIASMALRSSLAGLADTQPAWRPDWQQMTTALDALVGQFLCEEGLLHSAFRTAGIERGLTSVPASQDRDGEATSPLQPLARWLERFYTVMTEVQPRAIDIVSLRVEGFQDRDIAERLGLGLRLVKRIIREMCGAWKRATGKE